MEIEKAKKVRSVSLSKKTNEDLERLCEHLGVNVHSYIVNEIAKSVQRDSLSLMSKDSMTQMNDLLKSLAAQQ